MPNGRKLKLNQYLESKPAGLCQLKLTSDGRLVTVKSDKNGIARNKWTSVIMFTYPESKTYQATVSHGKLTIRDGEKVFFEVGSYTRFKTSLKLNDMCVLEIVIPSRGDKVVWASGRIFLCKIKA